MPFGALVTEVFVQRTGSELCSASAGLACTAPGCARDREVEDEDDTGLGGQPYVPRKAGRTRRWGAGGEGGHDSSLQILEIKPSHQGQRCPCSGEASPGGLAPVRPCAPRRTRTVRKEPSAGCQKCPGAWKERLTRLAELRGLRLQRRRPITVSKPLKGVYGEDGDGLSPETVAGRTRSSGFKLQHLQSPTPPPQNPWGGRPLLWRIRVLRGWGERRGWISSLHPGARLGVQADVGVCTG